MIDLLINHSPFAESKTFLLAIILTAGGSSSPRLDRFQSTPIDFCLDCRYRVCREPETVSIDPKERLSAFSSSATLYIRKALNPNLIAAAFFFRQ